MTRYSRKPAIVALLFSAGLGISALAATGQFRAPVHMTGNLDSLERAIASGKSDCGTWMAYAQALQQQHSFAHAGAAYERALSLQPAVEEAPGLRFNAVLCLGEAGDPEKFFPFFSHLATTDPKLAVDVLERPELATMRADSRWNAIAATARAQAAD